MDTGILDVLPVQATLIPKILLKLLLNEAHHGQPAGVWGESGKSENRDHSTGKGKRLARTVGVGSSFFGSNQRHKRKLAGEMSGSTGQFGPQGHQKQAPPLAGDGG